MKQHTNMPPAEVPSDMDIQKVENVLHIARPTTAARAVDPSRAAMEVQAQVIMAHKFPRDEEVARNKVLSSCQREKFAESALYAYPKGGATVSGPSIRMAEEIARAWGHINTGWGLVEQDLDKGYSDILAYAWDLQSGTRKEIGPFRVLHQRKTKDKTIKLTDDRDLYELCANMAQRRLRAAILATVPSWLVEEAVDLVQRVNDDAGSKDLPNSRKSMIEAFSKHSVTQRMLEDFAGVSTGLMTSRMVSELKSIYTTIKEGEAHPSEFFPAFPPPGNSAEAVRLAKGITSITGSVLTHDVAEPRQA